MTWKAYAKVQAVEMRPYEPGEDLTGVSIGALDKFNGSPEAGDMIARNPVNHEDQWLVSAAYFLVNYRPA